MSIKALKKHYSFPSEKRMKLNYNSFYAFKVFFFIDFVILFRTFLNMIKNCIICTDKNTSVGKAMCS